MKTLLAFALICFATLAQAAAPTCDARWQRDVQARLGGDGHGPDLGSAEWQGAVEHQLGLRDANDRGGPAWCQRVQQALDEARRAPTCRTRQVRGDVEELVCQRAGLARLDARVAEAYAAARRKAQNERPPVLAAEQRGWRRERHDCWKAGPDAASAADIEARVACVRESSQRRLLELQARYRLVPVSATARWRCDDGSEVVANFFSATEPPSLIAERGDQTSLMTQQPAASGSRYTGRNESYWEHQGEARVIWGWQSAELRCTKAGER
ncbi:MliC family protein [Roseateles sp. LYH14W]|uniref:MliC family protein n=1 Tax=Pelomonas parva TaxID=3299032 RepID=A0ABW7F8F3_9BURK